ncbi:3'-5' exonuclease [Aquisphaera insulae]|uniref:3'-5' exonuclease n=1 Tax=Aquisphaera insulae TaxID=2712864 RepID=UPI0013ED55FB|nr:3'-5' exonuclease [Aquisphaera insulae]
MSRSLRLERPLVVLDLETTGKRVESDRIVEISALKLSPDGARRGHTRRLNPGIPIPPEATKVHGITDVDVSHERTFAEIARGLADYLEGCDLCGFNVWRFDLRILIAEFRRVDVPFTMAGRHVIDPMRIYHRREPRDLAAALRFYCGREHEEAHRAEADVLAALRVLEAQVERYEDLPLTVSGLHRTMGYPDVVDPDGKFVRDETGTVVFGFGKHLGKPVGEVAKTDPSFLDWMLGRDFNEEAKDVARLALAEAGSLAIRDIPR